MSGASAVVKLPQSVSQLILWLAHSALSRTRLFMTIYMGDNYLHNPSMSAPVAPLLCVMAFLRGGLERDEVDRGHRLFERGGNGSLFLVQKTNLIVTVKWEFSVFFHPVYSLQALTACVIDHQI